MKNYRIAVIAGDGIGPEVIAEGEKVLKKAAPYSFWFRKCSLGRWFGNMARCHN